MAEYIVRETDCGLATKQEIVGELVRCKDCVCSEERVDKNRRTYVFCTFAQHPTVKHNYCVWGERKDNKEETNET